MDDDTTSEATDADGAARATGAATGEAAGDVAGDAVQAGLEQFQRAALDAVRAARTLLDAAESVLQEPASAKAVTDTVSAFARSATETVAGLAGAAWQPPDRPGPPSDPDGHDRADGREGPEDGFERIPVD